ncbi:TPA: hypothetical protein N0F65_004991 [Lagenidium giganteum]|uniref:CCHC-type domain-containing protein n=1 Tax=Lagenidium giganteum TaxID=4803 RepID=A0AAV2ZCF2_9STRA|nr:TPA: hypothetical protein N0F65_004991 [Lagenidium giganteum]
MRVRSQLLTCKQGKRTLHEYVQELRSLRAAVTSDPHVRGDDGNHLPRRVEEWPRPCQLFRAPPSPFEEAVTVALTEEHCHRGAHSSPWQKKDGSTPMELDTAGAERSIKCFNCGMAGHISRQCRKPRNQRGSNGQVQAQGGKRKSVLKGSGQPQESNTPAQRGTTSRDSGNESPQ